MGKYTKPLLLGAVIAGGYALCSTDSASAAAPITPTIQEIVSYSTDAVFLGDPATENYGLLTDIQFMGGRRTDYSRRGRYKGARTRFSRKRLPRGAASSFGPSRFTHGERYTGGQGVRITQFDNGFHARRKIRQRIR
ncbi:MAG: hypothetical protein AAF583_04970 [Pseudomonadota bacterium]